MRHSLSAHLASLSCFALIACNADKPAPKIDDAATSIPAAPCSKDTKNDPTACGSCETACAGAPCVNGACLPVEVIARDVNGTDIGAVDGSFVHIFDRSARVAIEGGKVETYAEGTRFDPKAFDGEYLYGWKKPKPTARGQKPPPPELLRRKGDGPETNVAILPGALWHALAVHEGTVYFARMTSVAPHVISDLVAYDMTKKTEKVLAKDEVSVGKIAVHGDAVYWIGMTKEELRTVSRAGGAARTLPAIKGAAALVFHGDALLVSGTRGIFRIPTTGGEPTLLLTGRPKELPTYPLEGPPTLASAGDHLYWTAVGKDVNYVTVLRTKLPR